MPMKFQLDFSIEQSRDRLQYIKDNIDLSRLSKKDIELCTNYILYGKDEDNKSSVDRGEIYIKPKYNSYSKQEPVSLEALMESPTFDETIFTTERNIFKKAKPIINKDKCKDIPGMKELWEEIEKINDKIQNFDPNAPSKQLYHLKHHLIELRKEQYMLKDSMFPEIQIHRNYGSSYVNPADTHCNYPVFPCGLMREEDDFEFKMPFYSDRTFISYDIQKEIQQLEDHNQPYFNFLDKQHIYWLCYYYYDIKRFVQDYPDSPLNNLLWTLDFYIEKARLSPQQILIVDGKKRRLLNKEICELLMEKLGIYHQENYISTIWNKITQLIANAADLNFDEQCCKDYKKAWKVCNTCGQVLLCDSRNFVKKTKSIDGFTNRCKRCDQKKRLGQI